MVDAFEVRTELAGVTDRAGAWRFIRGFAAAWATPLTDADGWDDAALDAAEARLGISLPAAVREAYALFGRRTDLTSNQDRLLEPKQLYVHDGLLVFRSENQNVSRWGVRLDGPDPAVCIGADLDDDTEPWEPWLDSFSLACVEIVLSEWLYAPEGFADHREIGEDDFEALERYTRLPLPEYPSEQAPGTRWFAGLDVLLREDERSWLTIRARTEEALVNACEDFGDGWLA